MLTIDVNQPQREFDAISQSYYWQGYRIQSERLSVGDFWFSYRYGRKKDWVPTVGVESKTWNDLLGSVASKRLMSQLTRLQARFPASCGMRACLLVQGEYEPYTYDVNPLDRKIRVRSGRSYRDTGWSVKEVEGFLATVQDRGVQVYQLADEGQLPAYMKWLYNHYESHKAGPDRFYQGSEVLRAMLDIVPGVTPALADKLVAERTDGKSLIGIVSSTAAELEPIVGSKVAKEIYSRFH